MITAYNADCLEAMRKMKDNEFDLAIVDPPYGINVANMQMGVGKSKKSSKIKNRKWKASDWDRETPDDEYFHELFRISKNQIIWGGNYFGLPATQCVLIWNKEIPEGLSFSDFEMAWTSFSRAAKMFSHSAYLDKGNKIHPTQKPVKLYEWLLMNYAKPGDKILDTHGGSFSHAIAAHNLNFDLTIFEIDKDYFDAGMKRLNQHQSQLTIF